jgi:hypothetical protein
LPSCVCARVCVHMFACVRMCVCAGVCCGRAWSCGTGLAGTPKDGTKSHAVTAPSSRDCAAGPSSLSWPRAGTQGYLPTGRAPACPQAVRRSSQKPFDLG